jgi:hypothetical protein
MSLNSVIPDYTVRRRIKKGCNWGKRTSRFALQTAITQTKHDLNMTDRLRRVQLKKSIAAIAALTVRILAC